jgi:hypothetical protein
MFWGILEPFFQVFFRNVGKPHHVKTSTLYHQPRQSRKAYMSTQLPTLAVLQKLALRRNYRSHNTAVTCSCSTPRITSATGFPFLGFWGPSVSKKADVAASGWCRPAAHRRPARSDSPGPDFALMSRDGAKMTSGLLQGSVGTSSGWVQLCDSEALLQAAQLLW